MRVNCLWFLALHFVALSDILLEGILPQVERCVVRGRPQPFVDCGRPIIHLTSLQTLRYYGFTSYKKEIR